MAKPLFNVVAFREIFPKQAVKAIQPIATTRAMEKFESAREEMIEEFNTHKVTQEIEAGPEVPNISQTLDGVRGNLFSFIGFEEESSPVEIVRQALRELCEFNKNPKITRKGNRILFNFQVKVPTLSNLEQLTPMPWEPGSWLTGIERGISGLGFYLFKLRGILASRSGKAVQVSNQLRSARFKNTAYISTILRNFLKKI